jgi:hypothetical protein
VDPAGEPQGNPGMANLLVGDRAPAGHEAGRSKPRLGMQGSILQQWPRRCQQWVLLPHFAAWYFYIPYRDIHALTAAGPLWQQAAAGSPGPKWMQFPQPGQQASRVSERPK